jgi:hypothetical protein
VSKEPYYRSKKSKVPHLQDVPISVSKESEATIVSKEPNYSFGGLLGG